MNKTTIIILSILATVVLALVLFSPGKRHYNWDVRTPNYGEYEPYGFALFDELLERSLPNGYTSTMLQPVTIDNNVTNIRKKYGKSIISHPDLYKGSADTALIVVKRYPWYIHQDLHADYEEEDYDYSWKKIFTEIDLLDFAEQGGTALLVTNVESNDVMGLLAKTLDINEEYNGYVKGYNLEDMAAKHPGEEKVDFNGNLLILNPRFADTYLAKDTQLHGNKPNTKKRAQIRPLMSSLNGNGYYMLEVKFPTSGGTLYVTNLVPYFTNIGLQIKHGDEVISSVMELIDDKPIRRIDYPYFEPWNVRGSASSEHSPLKKIQDNDSLRYLWYLGIALAVMLIAGGLLRKYPVSRKAIDELDRTDAVAMREYQFRHSPLLHFIFQCSWLYDGRQDYTDLFKINYRRMARMVSKYCGIELQTADHEALQQAARTLSARCGLRSSDILADLQWMQQLYDSGKTIKPKQFSKSQEIVERYPYT